MGAGGEARSGHLSIWDALTVLGYREEGELEPVYDASLLIKRSQGREPLVFSLRGSRLRAASNLLDTREKVFRLTGASSDVELYNMLTALPPRWEEVFESTRLEDHYEKMRLDLTKDVGAVKYYEKDAGLYLTSTIVIARAGDSYNASIHRMLVRDSKSVTARIVPRHLYSLLKEARSRGEELPVTILIGPHPLAVLAASTTPPFGYYELAILPRLAGMRSVAAVPSPVHGNPVPVGTSIIAEAWITGLDEPEGPFVDAMGTYDRVRSQPVIRVEETWAYTGSEPLTYPLLPGGLEHALLMGLPREASIYASVKRVVPRVGKVRLTPASGGWLHAVVSIIKNHEGDGKNAIMAAFAGHPSLKHVIVVDTDVDPDNPQEVEWALATRFQADRDLLVIRNARGSTLDPSASDGMTAKMGLDATKPLNAGIEYEKARIPGEG